MLLWQTIFIIFFGIFNLIASVMGLYQSKVKKNHLKITYFLLPLGIFVWADAVIFGIFWFAVSLTSLFLNDWIIFLLFFSVFWLVRSFGETIYYFNQQFSQIRRQPGKNLPGYSLFNDEYTIWFVYQIICQSITVISLVTSVYLFKLWLS